MSNTELNKMELLRRISDTQHTFMASLMNAKTENAVKAALAAYAWDIKYIKERYFGGGVEDIKEGVRIWTGK